MAQLIRQSTAATVLIGPAVDKNDGVTPEAGLTAGGVDEAVLYKHDGTVAVDISGTTTLTHRAGGMYTVTLSTTDTATAGRLTLYVRDDSVCLPMWKDFDVVPANVYDSLVAGSDQLSVDAEAVADAVLDESVSAHQSAGSLGAELRLAKAMLANRRVHTVSTGVDQVYDDNGTTLLRTLTPTDGGSDTIDVQPS